MNTQLENMKHKVVKSTSLALLIGVVLAGCATTPKNSPIMLEATSAVQTAESDPAVPQYASVELARAHGLLDDAHKRAQDHDLVASDHLAYLAKQTALTATARAKAKTDETILAKGETDRAHIQLQAREQEVGAARAAANAQAARANQSEAEAARLQQRSDELANELEQLKAKQTDRGLVLTLGDVLFDTGKSVLKPGAQKTIGKLAEFLQAHPERKLQIEGFTDSVGSDSYNLELSSRRADAVKSALAAQGVDSSRITTKGYGEEYPVASNDDNGGRQLNRRVEVVIGNDSANVPERSGPMTLGAFDKK
jgi:outer membrane protein OmpA-like peptidoglycan-associated protein